MGCDDWKIDKTCLPGKMVDLLLGLAIVTRLCPENVRDEGLRIAVVQWEPARLHLHHDAMAGQKDMVRRRQIEAVKKRLPCCNRLRILQALAIPAAEDVR